MSQHTHSSTPQPGDSYVQSFARGLEVIRSFSAAAPRQTLTDVATRTGLTRAGARRTPAEECAYALTELEAAIVARGPETVSAVFVEPITGASGAASAGWPAPLCKTKLCRGK